MHWYKASERKPPDMKDVLFVWLNGEIERMCIGYHDKDHDAWVETREGILRQATHWMFLPQPPSAVVEASDDCPDCEESTVFLELIGKTIEEATALLGAFGYYVRVVRKDGHPAIITRD